MMKRFYEDYIEDLAKKSGYSFDFLMGVFNEHIELDDEVDLTYFTDVTMEHDWQKG